MQCWKYDKRREAGSSRRKYESVRLKTKQSIQFFSMWATRQNWSKKDHGKGEERSTKQDRAMGRVEEIKFEMGYVQIKGGRYDNWKKAWTELKKKAPKKTKKEEKKPAKWYTKDVWSRRSWMVKRNTDPRKQQHYSVYKSKWWKEMLGKKTEGSKTKTDADYVETKEKQLNVY